MIIFVDVNFLLLPTHCVLFVTVVVMVVMFPRDSSSLVGMTLTLSDKNIVMHIQIYMFKREHMPVYK